ncbi:hypothetical protein D3C87_1609170 [compost metagenome]
MMSPIRPPKRSFPVFPMDVSKTLAKRLKLPNVPRWVGKHFRRLSALAGCVKFPPVSASVWVKSAP